MARVLYTNDVLATSGTGTSARLVPLVNAAFTVSTITGTPVPLYSSTTATSPIGSTVYSDANGIVKFYAEPGQYVAQITSGTTVNRVEDILVAGIGESSSVGGLPSGVAMVFPESAPYNITPNTPDATLAFQALIDESYVKYGTAEIILSGNYNISSLNVPDAIDIRGLHRSETGFKRVGPTVNGPMLVLKPITGRSPRRLRQQLSHFYMDGNNMGAIKSVGIVTESSNTVTGIPASTLAQIQVGYRIEGVGILKDTWVVSVGSTFVTMSNAADRSNSPKTTIMFRKGVSIVSTASIVGRTVTVESTNNIEVGMRVSGFLVEDDSGDTGTPSQMKLNAWTRVVAVDPINKVVTFDRDTVTSGSFMTNYFVGNDGVLVEEGWLAPNYNENLNYASVAMSEMDIINCGYHGLVVRGRRNQFQGNHLKISNNQGGGIVMVAANDSYLERVGTGTNWMWALYIAAMATPRWSGEAWQTYVNDKYPDVFIRGSREFTGLNSDINGRIYCMGNNDDSLTQQIYTLDGINFKWTNQNDIPGSTDTAYIEAKNCTVNVIGGGLIPDADSLERPHYGGKVTPGGIGAVVFHDQHWNDDPSDPWCPWSISMGRGNDAVFAGNVLSTKSKSFVGAPSKEVAIASSTARTLDITETRVCLTSASPVTAFTLNLPSSPPHGHKVSVSFGVSIASFTMTPSGTQTIVGAPDAGTKGSSFSVVYDRAMNRWILSS